MSIPSKLLSGIIVNRLSSTCKTCMREHQAGFILGPCCMNQSDVALGIATPPSFPSLMVRKPHSTQSTVRFCGTASLKCTPEKSTLLTESAYETSPVRLGNETGID